MNSADPLDDTEFSDALNELIERASANGVDIEGGWKCTTDGNGNAFWDVQITSVKYAESEED